jgi:hypothetical protein
MKQPVERKLAAILAADVAGYSRLMGADEEGTHERLRALFREVVDPTVSKHRGRIVKNIGDGFLAEFASVVDAVRCAVEVQREMVERNAAVPEGQRIEFRVGINLGDVIAERGDISVTVSTSRRDWKPWPSPAGYASAGSCGTRCATSSISLSKTWASSRSRTLPGQCASTGFGMGSLRPDRRWLSQHCRCPINHRSRYCPLPT